MIKKKNSHVQSSLKLAAIFSGILFLVKITAFWFSGSLLVLGSAFDSFGDTTMSLINRKVNALSQEGPDSQHPFGHGGFEVIGSLIQGTVLVVLGINLIIEALRRSHADAAGYLHSDKLIISAVVLAVSAFSGAAISAMLGKAEVKTNEENSRSLALGSDRAHYLADFFTNLLSALGLVVILFTGLHWVDQLLGGVAGILTIATGFPLLKSCFADIMHQEVSAGEQQQIVDIVFATNPKIEGLHQLRSRKLGPHLFVDFHMKLPAAMSLEEAHEIGDSVIRDLMNKFPSADVIVHLDPDSEPDQISWSPSYRAPDKNNLISADRTI